MPIAVPNRIGLACLLAALAMFGPFCIDAIFPAFPAIEEQFSASALAMQLGENRHRPAVVEQGDES